ncbi:MAG: hypothetical protein LBN29_11290 [Mediterranea sp.]|jgi:hypothetical protein|nr:hypothetical protein [Mediterranea sp.]
MLKELSDSAAARAGLGTSTHETGPVALTGNPYTDLAAYGIDLHGCSIRYRRVPNLHGNTITGRFNVCGREYTAGATSYEGIIHYMAEKHREYRRYVAECHKRRRERYVTSWEARHPGMTFNHCHVTFM